MTFCLIDPKSSKAKKIKGTIPVHGVSPDGLANQLKQLGANASTWVKANRFTAGAGQIVAVPGKDGECLAILLGLGDGTNGDMRFQAGCLPCAIPDGTYHLADGFDDLTLACLAWALGSYRFDKFKKISAPATYLLAPKEVDMAFVQRVASGVVLARDLINQPANDLGPEELEAEIRRLARSHKARVTSIKGAKLKSQFPMIHTVGRASTRAPRLVDMVWGKAKDPKITLVGKGVCFDTGGLNIKPGSSMALMKKDMGGAANVLGLASMIMDAKLPVRLRVLVPAVDNNISGNAFRPGDVLQSRLGISVEIGNTDAEGRLVLADALALADEEKPELLINMATLTGAARVALGPDLPPFYCDDNGLAHELARHSTAQADPIWRMPLWSAYDKWLNSKIADVNHISEGGFAGSITAALFLNRFVVHTKSYVHFDIFGWAPKPLPGRPVGGEAQAIRAIYALLEARYRG